MKVYVVRDYSTVNFQTRNYFDENIRQDYI